MHLHILGICGTFMAGIAQIASELGHQVTGSDENVYPPMSILLDSLGIPVVTGYAASSIPESADICVIGNALSRGNPAVEHILDNQIDFTSGPEWLYRNVLREREVIAIAGTHGKTTITSMVCHILEESGLSPGFLVGGVPGNFSTSARLGVGKLFVIEADEYDTAFFDKRSKFVHYHPLITLLNNLEFDHADIFADLNAIKTQFHHLVRTVPGRGVVVANCSDVNIMDTLSRGVWTPVDAFTCDTTNQSSNSNAWHIGQHNHDFSTFEVVDSDGLSTIINWSIFGSHNAHNALAASTVCAAAGVGMDDIASALHIFELPKRRLQLIHDFNDVRVFEDFAHHPTAIASTLEALAARYPASRLIAVVEPRSNTMKIGVHNRKLAKALANANLTLMLETESMQWRSEDIVDNDGKTFIKSFDHVDPLLRYLQQFLRPDDVVVLMSNGGFNGLQQLLIAALEQATETEPGTGNAVH
ncbi:MAG: UDP-N-acetylmuramate--L-alanyl-gamma-D-glutamyl-m eso-2,6-diaminoheptandioate ligase [marine bacterium B5-7]|nr:MAG: UDP-N-acetylmuramate--L-alanyl-gamma-D-glutamyl-m eso-2,6-diaminoheptandioate ligase [marine bacterium B5-7]